MLAKDIKSVSYNQNNLPKEHKFYIQVIKWIAPLFPNISSEKIETLSDAAYLYFKFLLSFDEFIDVQKEQ